MAEKGKAGQRPTYTKIQTDLPNSPKEFYSSTGSARSPDPYRFLRCAAVCVHPPSYACVLYLRCCSSPIGSRHGRSPGFRSPHDDDESGTATFNQTTFNAVNLLLGVGILSLPFAVKTSGWLICIPLLLFLSLVTNYTGKLIGRCLSYKQGMQSFADIGTEAFGPIGRRIITFLLFTELFTACCM